MIRSRARLALFVVLCAIVLLPRLGGPHLHLCLDGAGPAVALHMSDGDGEHSGIDDSHQDQTVEVRNPVFRKVWPPALDGALVLIFAVLLVIARQTAPRFPCFARFECQGRPCSCGPRSEVLPASRPAVRRHRRAAQPCSS
jgi:hypothetical protein